MEFLLPTEVARLVFGYLSEEGCEAAAKTFLETSPHTKECMMYAAKGRSFNTKILGLGLAQLLDVLAEVTCLVKSIENDVRMKGIKLEDLVNQMKVTLKLSTNEEGANKPVFLKFTMPTQTKTFQETKKDSAASSEVIVENDPGADVSTTPVNQSHALQVLLENKALHEKLAENINKVVAKKNDVDSLERILEKKIVETIVNTTEQDPFFQEMLHELVGPGDTEAPEDTEIECEEVRGGQLTEKNIVKKAMENSGVISPSLPVTYPNLQPSSSSAPGHFGYGTDQGVYTAQATTPSTFSNSMAVIPGGTYASPLTPLTFPTSQQSFVVTASSVRCSTTSSSVYPISCAPIRSDGGTATPNKTQAQLTRFRTVLPRPYPQVSTIKVLVPAKMPDPKASVPLQPYPTPPTNSIKVSGVRTRGGAKVGGLRTYERMRKASTVQQCDPNRKTGVLWNAPKVVPENKVVDLTETSTFSGAVSSVMPDLSVSVEASPTIEMSTCAVTTIETASTSTTVTTSIPPVSNSEVLSEAMNKLISPVTTSSPPSAPILTEPPLTAAEIPPDVEAPIVTTIETKSDSSSLANETKSSSVSISQDTASHREDNTTVIDNSTASELTTSKPDATPLQGSEPRVKLRKRLSLSTPRKGAHVRALEFKTPPKGLSMPRKSLSSPKHKAPDRVPQINKMLQNVKKSELFKSPPKKEKKSWDADLRNYTAEEDIPTSVGLKRKNPASVVKRKVPLSNRNKLSTFPVKSKTEKPGASPPKTPESLGKVEELGTNEDLVIRIQRDVMDVIDEEDIEGLNSNSLGANKIIDSVDISSALKSPFLSPETGSVLEIGDIGVPSSTIKKLYAKRTPTKDENSSTLDSPISQAPPDNIFSVGGVVSTPLRTSEKFLPNTPGSLEATLIKECSRIENEGMERARENVMLSLPRNLVFEENTDLSKAAKNPEENILPNVSLPPPKGIHVLKTPAKTVSSPPVEMTPISKIIAEETRVSTLLTPTIPPTPDYESLKCQNISPQEDNVSPSPRPPSDMDNTKLGQSPEQTPPKKKPKTPSKTPTVRFRNKQKQESFKHKSLTTKRKPASKKKVKSEDIDCSKLIAQCLQSVKESVFGPDMSDSEDYPAKLDSPTAALKKRSPNKKKKGSAKKKSKPEKEINQECPKVNKLLVPPTFAEVIDRYERSVVLSSSSGCEDVDARKESNEVEKTVDETINNDVSKSISDGLSENSALKNKTNEIEMDEGVQNGPSPVEKSSESGKVVEESKNICADATADEIESPPYSPLPSRNVSQTSVGPVDLISFMFPFKVEAESGLVTRYLRPSSCFSLFELPAISPVTAANRSSKPAKLSNDAGKGGMHESSRRRKRSDSDSNDEVDSMERKRRRDYRAASPRPIFRRGRGRGRGRSGVRYRGSSRDYYLGRSYEMNKSGWPYSKSEERKSRRYSESSDDGNRRKIKSQTRSFSYSKERSKSRSRVESDDRRSPDRSRFKKHPVEPSSSVRTEKVKTPGNEIRRGEPRVLPAPPPRKAIVTPDSLSSRRSGEKNTDRSSRDLEDGEISDTSLNTVLSYSKKISHHVNENISARLSSPVADDSRQALLQKVDLDHFLSIVHGEAK